MGKKQSVAELLQLTPAQEEERLSGLRRLARAIMAAIKKVLSFLFGGAFGDIGRDVGKVKGLAGRAAIGAAYGVEGVARGLDAGYRFTHGLASGVGSILGALVPRPPVGPADVAAAAAAQDNREVRENDGIRGSVRAASAAAPTMTAPAAAALAQPAPAPVETVALVREAVALLQRQDLAAGAVIAKLPHRIGNWLAALDAADLGRLAALTSGSLHRHVTGVEAAPGLTPVTVASHDMMPTADELARILRLSTQGFHQAKFEAASMAQRPGSAPRPRLPTEPLYGEEAERSFAASPRAATAY
ncbi:hypothetical protein E8E01_00385 [Methylorubrum populi]|uniref:hypothetical protein n=1 Tax=Methylorubrum populi TaxID=223967 RepID=UPI0011537A32|nr:hypothetical protein [Methylorubrum populi]QDI79013.1 hypothetical protein E8E01_00385 [Methylorubrum populi]